MGGLLCCGDCLVCAEVTVADFGGGVILGEADWRYLGGATEPMILGLYSARKLWQWNLSMVRLENSL